MARREPAPLPISAIAGVTSPMIIKGMRNWRKFPNIPLNVANTRIAPRGRTLPRMRPRAMAVNIRGSSPNFFFFTTEKSYGFLSSANLMFMFNFVIDNKSFFS